MQSNEETVEAYIESLPADRRQAIRTIREVILRNLPKGYVETMQWGMICYSIPLDVFPDTYNKQPLCYASLASQKNYMSLYLMSVYGEEDKEFRQEYEQTGKKLDMGKSCVRFKKLEDLPLELIGKTIAKYTPDEFIAKYKAARG